MSQNPMQISFSVEARVFQRLQERATKMNLRASQYAQRLFEAAYFVRVVQERGEEQPDAELDRQVRTVFLLADCEPEFIAEAIGAPSSTVKKILAGWRTYFAGDVAPGREIPAAQAPAAAGAAVAGDGTKVLPPPVAKDGGYPVDRIREMWAAGTTVKQIAAAIGKTEGAFSMWASNNRDVCPKRVQAKVAP